MDIRIDITSIGRVAGELQIPLCDIRDAAEQLGIRPHHVNGVVHFDTDDVRRIDRHIHGDQRPEANARH